MDYFGLIIEIAFLIFGVYMYLFAIGKTKAKNAAGQKKAEAFRKDNGWWLRMASLALVAIMLINIIVHIQQLLR